jgi:flagellar biosynthesis/type III secretory pathway protein FliH
MRELIEQQLDLLLNQCGTYSANSDEQLVKLYAEKVNATINHSYSTGFEEGYSEGYSDGVESQKNT